MSRVEINGGERHIIVDGDGSVEHVAKIAFSLWEQATTPLHSPGPAVGFSVIEQGLNPTVEPSVMLNPLENPR